MRGGAQSHLMRCEDGGYYVVKFQNNPQGARILANELLGTRLAARMGLPTPAAAVVEVRENLIEHTDDLVIQLGRGRTRCRAGLQFGSRYPGSPADTVVYDFLPDEQLREVVNLADFCGMLVFDKWTCNTNGRQAVFFRAQNESRYQAWMIDQGFCFNAVEWNFPDAPLARALRAPSRVRIGARNTSLRALARAHRRENDGSGFRRDLQRDSGRVVRIRNRGARTNARTSPAAAQARPGTGRFSMEIIGSTFYQLEVTHA